MLADIRYALRMLGKNPSFALVAILSVALGVGANSAIFSLADAIILRPLPVHDPSGLVNIEAYQRGENFAGMAVPSPLSYPDFLDVRARGKSFEALTGFRYSTFGFAATKDALPEIKFGLLVSGNFLRVLGVPPALGRDFRPDEDRVPGRDAVAIISHDLWADVFDSSRSVLGRTIYVGGIAFTVVGVTPEKFTGVDQYTRPALYIPMMMGPRLAADPQHNFLEQRDDRSINVKGRLRPGVSLAAATAEVNVIASQLAQAYPKTNRNFSAAVETEFQRRVRQSPPDAVIVGFMLLLAGIVLLIACANVANLMLTRARARSREIAVRLAIGAGRGRLIRQLLTESLLIALLGGALGLLVAQAGADAFSSLKIPAEVPVVLDVRLDPRVVLFALFASLASALLFGLVPTFQATRTDLVTALKSGAENGSKRRRLLGRNTLVSAQVAGSLLLVVVASQLFRGTRILLTSPAGFRTDHILMASFDPTLARYTPAHSQDFYRRLLEKARTLPGVKNAALARTPPIATSNPTAQVVPESFQLPAGTETVTVLRELVSDAYFETGGIPILRGRGFLVTDTAASPHVAVVNEQLARKYFPNQDPVGKRIRIGGRDAPWTRIVGLAKQSKYFFLAEPPIEALYLPEAQHPETGMTLLIQSSGPPGELTRPLRDLVRSLDPAQPMFAVRTMEEYFDQRSTKVINVITEAFAAMALLGLVLALVGLYGLMTYSVSRRTREIGIRMAIGAGHLNVLRMVLRQGMVLAGTGAAIGLTLSLLLSRALTAALRVPPFNLALLALVSIGLLAVAALGAYVPAHRAALVDPVRVLRQE